MTQINDAIMKATELFAEAMFLILGIYTASDAATK